MKVPLRTRTATCSCASRNGTPSRTRASPAAVGLYVLEANPRASRTVPFVAKATGVPLVDHACRLLLGEKLEDLGLPERAGAGPDRQAAAGPLSFVGNAASSILTAGPEPAAVSSVDLAGREPRKRVVRALAIRAQNREPACAPVQALVEEATGDLRDDFDELTFLARAARARLGALVAELDGAGDALHAGSGAAVKAVALDQVRRYDALLARLAQAGARAAGPPDRRRLAELSVEQASLADLARTLQALVGPLVSACDWQSPPFLSSTRAGTGPRAARITPHWNDYKRDRHLDAAAYERAYVAELVDGPADARALLTSCGMAAFTTILAFLGAKRHLDGPVVIGRGLYHETKLLLRRAVGDRIDEVDEADTDEVLRAIAELRPGAIFLDSLCNTTWAPMPDLQAVVRFLHAQQSGPQGLDAVLVVDNTGLGASCQPLARLGAQPSPRVIVFESLLKYAQLGLDRVNAGVIVARGGDAEALSSYREHLGTNVADVAAGCLPPPDRSVLERRLHRLGRNADRLAECLHDAALRLPVEIVHPSLPAHPAYARARRLRFRGGCVSIAYEPADVSRLGPRLLETAIFEARRRRVTLVGGSSFGFDATRIYLTAAPADCGEPFVRIAAGTENRLEIERVGEVLARALRRTLG